MTTAMLAVPYSQIPARPVHWLHDGFVPFRHVTVVIGQGGTSKGICTLDYAARMTRGDPMPGEVRGSAGPADSNRTGRPHALPGPAPGTGHRAHSDRHDSEPSAPGEAETAYDGPMDVVVVLPEDDPNEAVAGRLAGAGAIADRVHNLTVLPGGHSFTVPADIPLIGQAIDQIEAMDPPADGHPRTVGMVILDPLLALAENDLRTRGQARPVMEALEQVAQQRHLVIFLTHHANADGKAASSRAITETARNVITLARTPKASQDDPVRVLTVTKTNIGMTGQSLRYALTGSLEQPHVAWECEQPAVSDSRGYDTVAQVTHDPGKRYRASRMYSSAGQYGKPEVLGDCDSRQAAKRACEQAAGQLLGWHAVPVPGMEGAEVTMAPGPGGAAEIIYGTLDRYAKAAASTR